MILVDTSVWVAHFRLPQLELVDRLQDGEILMHPFVVGELACGNMRQRETILRHIEALPAAVKANDAEVRGLIEKHRLWGRGIGWVDAHLLASTLLSQCQFWTLDRLLTETASHLGVSGPRRA
jgi:predicted nucleic acid-binding protein